MICVHLDDSGKIRSESTRVCRPSDLQGHGVRVGCFQGGASKLPDDPSRALVSPPVVMVAECFKLSRNTMTSEIVSILCPAGSQRSTCGYCSPLGQRSATRSSYSVGVTAAQLSCAVSVPYMLQKKAERNWTIVGVPKDDRQRMEKIGNVSLQTRHETDVLSSVYDSVGTLSPPSRVHAPT